MTVRVIQSTLMTVSDTEHRVTFGVSASSFAANMAVKQNATEYAQEFPLAADVIWKCFYVDNCLTGADNPNSALILQHNMYEPALDSHQYDSSRRSHIPHHIFLTLSKYTNYNFTILTSDGMIHV